jgi:hypothetical protein
MCYYVALWFYISLSDAIDSQYHLAESCAEDSCSGVGLLGNVPMLF